MKSKLVFCVVLLFNAFAAMIWQNSWAGVTLTEERLPPFEKIVNLESSCDDFTNIFCIRDHVKNISGYFTKSSLSIGQNLVFFGNKTGGDIHDRSEAQIHGVFPVTPDYYDWLPEEEFPYPSINTCAVVGNSATLKGSGLGSEIDAHEAVFRVNGAPYGGNYSQDVGSNCTFMTINTVLRSFRRVEYAGDNTSIPIPPDTTILTFVSKHDWHVEGFSEIQKNLEKEGHPRAYPLSNDLMWFTQEVLYFHIHKATSGMWLVMLAVKLCNNVDVYGFYPFSRDENRTILRYAYYRNDQWGASPVHDLVREFQVLYSWSQTSQKTFNLRFRPSLARFVDYVMNNETMLQELSPKKWK